MLGRRERERDCAHACVCVCVYISSPNERGINTDGQTDRDQQLSDNVIVNCVFNTDK